MIIADTNVVSEFMRETPDVAEKSATLRVASSWPPATQMPAI